MVTRRAAAVVVVAALGGGCAAARVRARESSAGRAEMAVTLRNRSRFDVHGLALRGASRRAWGADALGDAPLRAGQDRVLRLAGCAPRDLRLVDGRGEACELEAVAVCAENDGFTLTTEALLRCERWR